MKTIKEVKNLCEQGVHISWRRGYIPRRIDGLAYTYNGLFGRGYVIYRPSSQLTQSHVEFIFIND